MLGAVRDQHVFRLVGDVVFLLIFGRDGLAKVLVSRNRRIGKILSFVDCRLGGFADVLRRFEVGLAQAQADNIDSPRPEFTGFLRHGKRGRFLDGLDAIGKMVHLVC